MIKITKRKQTSYVIFEFQDSLWYQIKKDFAPSDWHSISDLIRQYPGKHPTVYVLMEYLRQCNERD